MKLKIADQAFLIGGASSGFGLAISELLIAEGATVLGVARGLEKLQELEQKYPGKFIGIQGNLAEDTTVQKAVEASFAHLICGVVVNAGGPPAMKFDETSLTDWDSAYANILRWKVNLTKQLLPLFKQQGYGRMVFIESSSVKQPMENLVLSTSLRLAVVGLVKTLSQEEAGQGINFNILAPGSHETPAINRLIEKKASMENSSFGKAKSAFLEAMPSNKLGSPENFGSLAVWLLSPLSEFVNGQVFAVEGGTVKSTL